MLLTRTERELLWLEVSTAPSESGARQTPALGSWEDPSPSNRIMTDAFKDPPGNGDSTFKSPSRELTGSENLCPLPTQGPLHPSSRTCLHGISEIGRDYNSRGGLDQNMLILPFERKTGI